MAEQMTEPIIALDVPSAADAMAIVADLGELCGFYKVGTELFTAEGSDVVRRLMGAGKKIFLDLKLHDIPHTVEAAARSASRIGASLLTVHSSGGDAMMRAAVSGAGEVGDRSANAGGLAGIVQQRRTHEQEAEHDDDQRA